MLSFWLSLKIFILKIYYWKGGEKMKKIFGFLSLAVAGVLSTVGYAHAAADTDLASAFSTTTTFMSDNKSQILTFIVGISMSVLVILIAKRAIAWGMAKIKASFGGGRRRR